MHSQNVTSISRQTYPLQQQMCHPPRVGLSSQKFPLLYPERRGEPLFRPDGVYTSKSLPGGVKCNDFQERLTFTSNEVFSRIASKANILTWERASIAGVSVNEPLLGESYWLYSFTGYCVGWVDQPSEEPRMSTWRLRAFRLQELQCTFMSILMTACV